MRKVFYLNNTKVKEVLGVDIHTEESRITLNYIKSRCEITMAKILVDRVRHSMGYRDEYQLFENWFSNFIQHETNAHDFQIILENPLEISGREPDKISILVTLHVSMIPDQLELSISEIKEKYRV